MNRLLRNHEKFAGWLLVIAFMFSSSFGAARSSCCCTVLDFDQTRLSTVNAESQFGSLSRPACCLPKQEIDQAPGSGEKPIGLSSNCDCQFSSGLVAIEPFKAKLELHDGLFSRTSTQTAITDVHEAAIASAEQAIDSPTRCSLQCSWQE